jgi:hypothetical protein
MAATCSNFGIARRLVLYEERASDGARATGKIGVARVVTVCDKKDRKRSFGLIFSQLVGLSVRHLIYQTAGYSVVRSPDAAS